MTVRAFTSSLLLACLTAGFAPARAHHSPAMFDLEKTLELTGTVRLFQWTNPHCYIQLLVRDAQGRQTEWSLEMGAPMYLYNRGWRPSTLKPGDQVTVKYSPLRKGGTAGLLQACSRTPDASAAVLPDWSGVWVAADTDIDISGYPTSDSPAGMAIDLLDFAAAPWNEAQRQWMATELPKIWAADALRRGQGWGYPLMMEAVAPMQFLVTPQETLILNFYRDLRHVYTDGRALPPEEDRWPTPWGDSVGHWEGDTLVIQTVSVRNGSVLPLPLPPLSPDARFTERLRKSAPDRMHLAMTIEDPAVLSAPWTLEFEYRRAEGIDRLIHDVMENDRSTVEGSGLTIAPVP